MPGILVELFKHNTWANLCLLAWCRGFGEEQLRASAPGTYGQADATLMHLLAAEQRYLERLTGERPEQPLHESHGFAGLDELERHARRSGEALATVAARTRSTRVLRGTWRGEPYAIPAAVVLLQAINHATEHRAHVMTVLSQHGIQPPELDGWAYGDHLGRRS